ncbi:hypothetical protein PSACC_01521 [Paramicrosporidium saccamoebae]|uniref:Uncharacterized protein n=1 Tax=Paramicrosporidium saccamoebae TaxID=1246581 RepID=A0A2H9TLN2_9FUNG|nr:hypothetical protein PSACC_01521 [Paramicrosporidium saccamoebae]
MIQKLLPQPNLHPTLLSFRFCSMNSGLVNIIRPHLQNYSPTHFTCETVLNNHFTDEDMKCIFKKQGFRPEFYWHNNFVKEVIRLVPEMSYDLNDALWAAGNKDVPLQHDLGYRLITISAAITSSDQPHPVSIPRVIADDAEFFTALEGFLTGPSWHDHYPVLLRGIKKETEHMTPARGALWHGKCLLLAYKQLIRCSQSGLTDYLIFFLAYVEEHNLESLPPYTLRKIFKRTRELGLIHSDNEALRKKFMKISVYMSDSLAVLDDLSQHVQRWRYDVKALQRQYRTSLERPDKVMNEESLLNWWGAYEILADAILFNPIIQPPIIYRDSSGEREIGTVEALLEVLKSILIELRGPLVYTESCTEFTENYRHLDHCKAFARTICANLFHVGDLGFSFSHAALDKFYSVDSPGTLQQCVKDELKKIELLAIPIFVFKRYAKAPSPAREHDITLSTVGNDSSLNLGHFAILVIILGLSLNFLSFCASLMDLSSNSIFYELSYTEIMKWFNSYDLNCEMSINYLFRLLVTSNGWLKHFYDSQEIGPKRAQEMVRKFLPRPDLHPVLLSFRLCSHNAELVESLRPNLHLYRPTTLGYLPDRQRYFTDEDMRCILRNQGFRPEFYYCTDSVKEVIRLIPEMAYDLNDALWATGNKDVALHYDLGCKLTTVSTVIASLGQSHPVTIRGVIVDDAEFFTALEEFLTGPSRHKFYPVLLEYVENCTKLMTPARRALWHGKLLYMDTVLALASKRHVKENHQFVLDYVKKHKVKDLPPVLLCNTFRMVRDLGLITINDNVLRQKFALISQNYLHCPLVLADLPQHVQRWRSVVKVLQQDIIASSTRPDSVDMRGILQWWSTYENLADATVFNPKFRSPITYRGAHRDLALKTVTSLLVVLKAALVTPNGPLISTKSGVKFHKENYPIIAYCKAIARTICVSLFHMENLGFSFTDDVLDQLYSPTSHSYGVVQQCVKEQLATVDFFSCIPRTILKGHTTAPVLVAEPRASRGSKVNYTVASTQRVSISLMFFAPFCVAVITVLLSILDIL